MNEPSKEALSTKGAIWDAIWDWVKAEGYEKKLEALVKVNDALDAFAAARVEAERKRCLWWVRAYAAYPQSNPAAREIEVGSPPKARYQP